MRQSDGKWRAHGGRQRKSYFVSSYVRLGVLGVGRAVENPQGYWRSTYSAIPWTRVLIKLLSVWAPDRWLGVESPDIKPSRRSHVPTRSTNACFYVRTHSPRTQSPKQSQQYAYCSLLWNVHTSLPFNTPKVADRLPTLPCQPVTNILHTVKACI